MTTPVQRPDWLPDPYSCDLLLSDDHCGAFHTYAGETEPAMLVVYHRSDKAPSGLCSSAVVWRNPLDGSTPYPPGKLWALVAREPLEVSPSLLCLTCGDHGWIRGGRWVPA